MRRPIFVPILCALALAGCDAAPPAPAKSAQTQEEQQAEEASALRTHIQTPIDKAKGVEDVQAAHDAEQAAAVDAMEAGEEVPADEGGDAGE